MRTKVIALFAILVSFFMLNHQAWAKSQTALTELTNLPELAIQSNQQQLPIMLIFSAEWCEYCEILDEYVFTPMILGKLYDNKLMLMRHVGLDEPEPITDWDGQSLTKEQWAYKLDADLTPTVLFVNAQGKEIAPRIIGIPEISLYANVIHRNLNIAYKNMGLSRQIPTTPELLDKQSLQAR